MNNAFRHLDPSTTKIYRGTVVYGLECAFCCMMLKVKNGYVVETPNIITMQWIRGQHIETLQQYFRQILPLRMVADGL